LTWLAMAINESKTMKKTVRNDGEDPQVKLFSFFEELAEPVRKLVQTAWRSRGKLVHDVKAYVLLFTSMVCSMPARVLRVIQNPKLQALLAEEEDPQALAAVVAGTGGALCLGSVGAVIGVTVGAAVGLCVGAVPALFTLGLSLPLGALLGGSGGLLAGAFTGSSAGFVGGATSGTFLAYFRSEIRLAVVFVSAKVYDVYHVIVVRPTNAVKAANRKVRDGVHVSTAYTQEKARATADFVKTAASNRHVQVSTAGAGFGAAALGTAGAASGACVGGTVGALVGLVPAVFTFGLSIPIGAAVGGSTGLFVGGAAGCSLGFAGGGSVAFLAYSQRGLPAAVYNYFKPQAVSAVAEYHAESAKIN